jgi:hypothetical protein
MSRLSKSIALTAILLLVISDRLPAPIQEVPESPTPAPEQSAKPKPKRTIKPKATGESSESSTKRQRPSPTPKIQSTQQSRFAGSWAGVIHTLMGDIAETITVNTTETAMTVVATSDGRTKTAKVERRGDTLKANFGSWGSYSLTPLSDGSTALVHYQNLFDDDTASYRRTTTESSAPKPAR